MRVAAGGSSTQTTIACDVLGAGGVQHVEPRAVAVVDLEAEVARGSDHLDVVVDDRDVDGRARRSNWLAICPTRPKPMTSTLPCKPFGALDARRSTGRAAER